MALTTRHGASIYAPRLPGGGSTGGRPRPGHRHRVAHGVKPILSDKDATAPSMRTAASSGLLPDLRRLPGLRGSAAGPLPAGRPSLACEGGPGEARVAWVRHPGLPADVHGPALSGLLSRGADRRESGQSALQRLRPAADRVSPPGPRLRAEHAVGGRGAGPPGCVLAGGPGPGPRPAVRNTSCASPNQVVSPLAGRMVDPRLRRRGDQSMNAVRHIHRPGRCPRWSSTTWTCARFRSFLIMWRRSRPVDPVEPGVRPRTGQAVLLQHGPFPGQLGRPYRCAAPGEPSSGTARGPAVEHVVGGDLAERDTRGAQQAASPARRHIDPAVRSPR